MSTQRGLFDSNAHPAANGDVPPIDRFKGAMACSAIGDALGWPTEFLRADGRRPPFSLPIRDFVKWEKLVGGRWWGYRDDIEAGEYSDDTQLTLAIARSISSGGEFEPERFAYSEFPLWLHYERGGGRSIKAAARALIRQQVDCLHNFYKQGDVKYVEAGANGAAMRNLPIALVTCRSLSQLVRDSFFNAVVSHGHPRAILGTILYGAAIHYALSNEPVTSAQMVPYLAEVVDNCGRWVADDSRVMQWAQGWEKAASKTFKDAFAETRREAHTYLSAIVQLLAKPIGEYYGMAGALEPQTKGSGLGTVCVAIYLFLRYHSEPAEAVYAAVNQLGSDTDTIAAFVGSLTGARYGADVIPRHLWDGIQDRDYILKTATRLHAIASGELGDHAAVKAPLPRHDGYSRILAWEIGLHEMFWDAIDVGGSVVHPTIGRGTITGKEVRNIAREGYVAKLIRIRFDCGQTCVFHSRVENNDKVSESLAQEVEKALRK